MIGVFEVLIAFTIIMTILISSGFRLYFKRRFDPSEYKTQLNEALKRQHNAKTRLHNAHNK